MQREVEEIEREVERLQAKRVALLGRQLVEGVSKLYQQQQQQQTRQSPHMGINEAFLRRVTEFVLKRVLIDAVGVPLYEDVSPVVRTAMRVQLEEGDGTQLPPKMIKLLLEVMYCSRNSRFSVWRYDEDYLQRGRKSPWVLVCQQEPYERTTLVRDTQEFETLARGIAPELLRDNQPDLVVAMLLVAAFAGYPMCLYGALLQLDPNGSLSMLLIQAQQSEQQQLHQQQVMNYDEEGRQWCRSINTLTVDGYGECPHCDCNTHPVTLLCSQGCR